MKITIKYLLVGCFVILYNYGFSQCSCVDSINDIRIIELSDTITSQGPSFIFKMTSDSSNCNTGYSDFWFVDQLGDTINQYTGSGMWMPNPSDPMFDTTRYIIELKPGYSSFPPTFSGNLHVWNPSCTIPFTLVSLATNEIINSNSDIQLFPNPTSDEAHILNRSNLAITFLEVYDSNGKLIASKTKNTDYIRTDAYLIGVYYVKIYSNQKIVAVEKLIKN